MAEPKLCPCGGKPEVIKLYESKRYDCFIRCPECGYEGRLYVSKQGAVRAWNRRADNALD